MMAPPQWLPRDSLEVALLVLGYPVLVLASLEVARALDVRGRAIAASVLRQIAYLLLPAAALWIILRQFAELPAGNNFVRTAATVCALSALYLLLRVLQSVVIRVLDSQTTAPKLLLDVLRIGLSAIWGAAVVSVIWDVDVSKVFAALGIGSVVLGFALQQYVGNLLSGLSLLSSKRFGIGDWLVVDGSPARVVEMDWNTVLLSRSGADRIVVANSTLAKDNLRIAARADAPAAVDIPLSLGADMAPERVRAAVLEAGTALPGLLPDAAVTCVVTGIAGGLIDYRVTIPVANPGAGSGPRDAFLSRFWYAAQRHGLRLTGAVPADAEVPVDEAARLRMLTALGVFHGDVEVLAMVARDGVFRRYRRADTLLRPGAPIGEAFLVLSGVLAMTLFNGEGETPIEHIGSAQLLVLAETLTGGLSPVRVTIDQDADMIVIPARTLQDVIERHPIVARDIRALADARRRAIQPLRQALSASG
nr:mechanosensitive ion channel domain-containing protein [uncultured Rhodopila sp.]